MAQEIITYIIVLAAVSVAGYKFYKSIIAKKKGNNGCGNCGCDAGSCKTLE